MRERTIERCENERERKRKEINNTEEHMNQMNGYGSLLYHAHERGQATEATLCFPGFGAKAKHADTGDSTSQKAARQQKRLPSMTCMRSKHKAVCIARSVMHVGCRRRGRKRKWRCCTASAHWEQAKVLRFGYSQQPPVRNTTTWRQDDERYFAFPSKKGTGV